MTTVTQITTPADSIPGLVTLLIEAVSACLSGRVREVSSTEDMILVGLSPAPGDSPSALGVGPAGEATPLVWGGVDRHLRCLFVDAGEGPNGHFEGFGVGAAVAVLADAIMERLGGRDAGDGHLLRAYFRALDATGEGEGEAAAVAAAGFALYARLVERFAHEPGGTLGDGASYEAEPLRLPGEVKSEDEVANLLIDAEALASLLGATPAAEPPCETEADLLRWFVGGLRLAVGGCVRSLSEGAGIVWAGVEDTGAWFGGERTGAVRYGGLDRATRRVFSWKAGGRPDATFAAAILADAMLTWHRGVDQWAGDILTSYAALLAAVAADDGDGLTGQALEATAGFMLTSLRSRPEAAVSFRPCGGGDSWAVVYASGEPVAEKDWGEFLPLFTDRRALGRFIKTGDLR